LLLNVAVTRAKRRLYVIGNHETWGSERYFTALKDRHPQCSGIVWCKDRYPGIRGGFGEPVVIGEQGIELRA
jgi:hypothetical protein